MRTRLSRSTWALLLGLYALAAGLAWLFTGVQVAPCLGGVGPEGDAMRRRCAEQWFASRPVWEQLLGTPVFAVLVFAALVATTAWLTRERDPRASQAR
jgi:hypothetical protein